MHEFLNLEIMKNPYNWIIVTLMVLIAGLMVSLLFNRSKGVSQ